MFDVHARRRLGIIADGGLVQNSVAIYGDGCEHPTVLETAIGVTALYCESDTQPAASTIVVEGIFVIGHINLLYAAEHVRDRMRCLANDAARAPPGHVKQMF